MKIFEPDPGSTLIVGRGFNSLTLSEMASGVDDTSIVQPMGATGQTVTYEIRQIEDITTLRKSLNLSASASLSGGIGSASVKARFFNSINFNSYSLYLYVHVRVSNASFTLKDYLLTENTSSFLKEYGKEAFFENYGDEFVSSYTTGGELIAIVQINNRTVQEKTTTETSFQGGYGNFNSSAEFSEAIDSLNISNATQAYVIRRGGNGPVPDIKDIKQAALDFPPTVSNDGGAAVLLQVRTVPYALVTNRPNNISLIGLETQRLELEKVAIEREKAVVARSDYRFAATHPYFFFKPDVNALNSAIVECDTLINRIDASVRACLLEQGRTFIDPHVTVPEIPLDWTIPLDCSLAVMAHIEGYGDFWGGAHQYIGTKGENRRMEGISIALNPAVPGLYIEYFVHLEGHGDTAWARDGAYCGTRGEGRRIEGFQIHLLGPLAPLYDVVYTGHIESIGDVQKQNDEYCGTRGQNLRCEGIQVSITRRK